MQAPSSGQWAQHRRAPVDNLYGPPAAVALVQQSLIALCELVLLPEGAQREQPLQALIEIAKDG